MTPDWIAQARTRCEQATPGPWELRSQGVDMRPHPWTLRTEGVPGIRVYLHAEQVDAEFIAAARTDLPRALDALERVRALCDDEYACRRCPMPSGHMCFVCSIRAALDGDA